MHFQYTYDIHWNSLDLNLFWGCFILLCLTCTPKFMLPYPNMFSSCAHFPFSLCCDICVFAFPLCVFPNIYQMKTVFLLTSPWASHFHNPHITQYFIVGQFWIFFVWHPYAFDFRIFSVQFNPMVYYLNLVFSRSLCNTMP